MTASPLLLIVGMHRSGTSLLGSLLPACGITMPGALIPGDTHNPEGYFERADVTALQEQLLIDLERWWPSPRGMEPLPEGWLESPLGQQALADLVALLQPEAERQQGAWAIKDPRSSLLLPLWKAACRQLGIPLQLLLAVRDPAEVMVSLVRRDQAVTGMDGWRAQRLWWHHNAQVLRDGADLPLQVVSYSHWFDPAHARQQLRGLAPHLSDAALQVALQTVKPEHRRSRQQPAPAHRVAVVRRLQRRLQRLALAPPSRQARQRHALEHWLDRQPPLPLPRRLWPWQRRQPQTEAGHPWAYLAGLLCGSAGPASQQLLQHWLQQGFSPAELAGFSVLPGPIPPAEAWPVDPATTVQLQLRGALEPPERLQGWLRACPLRPEAQVQAVPLGAAGADPIALNLTDLEAGPAGAADLLQLAGLERVWDPDRRRVQLLRQFGVRASWLPADSQPAP